MAAVSMNGREFIRRARRYARRTEQDFRLDTRRGKGSHALLRLDSRRTTVPQGEIGRGLLASMLKDLSIDRGEF